MGFWKWLKARSNPLPPEQRWQVWVDRGLLIVIDPAGQTQSVALADLSTLTITTNDTGPIGIDMWIVAASAHSACSYPHGAKGEQAALDYYLSLPGFDLDKFGKAMRSTDNAVFTVWRRDTRDEIVLEGPGWQILGRDSQYLLAYSTGGHEDAWRRDEITTADVERVRADPYQQQLAELIVSVQRRVRERGEDPHISNNDPG